MRKLIVLLLALTMILSLGLSFGESIDDLQRQIDEKNNNIAEKKEELSGVQGELQITEQAYYDAVAQVDALKAQIAETEEKIEVKGKEIEKTQKKVDKAKEEYNFQAEEFGGRLSTMYMSKDESFWSMIFNAEGFEDLLMRISNYRRIVKMDEETLKELDAKKQALQKLEDQLKKENEELKKLGEQQKVDKAAAEVKSAELEEIKKGLQAKAEAISNQISAEEAAGYELQGQMDYLIEQARQKRIQEEEARRAAEEAARQEQNGGGSEDSGSVQDPNRDHGYVGGSWQWPAPGNYYISYYFGNRVHPLYGTSDFHNGIDILGDMGAPIVAARDGLVIHAGWYSGYGECVIIDHGDGTQSLYAHGTGVNVSVGQYVSAGTTVMPMGSTGISTAVHLHFGIMSGGSWVDPTGYVGG